MSVRGAYERPSKWEMVEWHMPSGRRVWSTEKPVAIDYGISDGTVRHDVRTLPEGMTIEWIEVDGERWRKRPQKDFDNIDSEVMDG